MSLTKNNKAKNQITIIRKRNNKKVSGVNTLKYCGTVKFNEDALIIQKRLRNEWR
jgi:hypothetical protein